MPTLDDALALPLRFFGATDGMPRPLPSAPIGGALGVDPLPCGTGRVERTAVSCEVYGRILELLRFFS